jgi:transcriptional regulator with GAF, ATPase, and Fis domain
MFEHVGDLTGAALAEANLGVANLEAGDAHLAVKRLGNAIEVLLQAGASHSLPLIRALLARAHALAGQPAAAKAALVAVGDPANERVRDEVLRARAALDAVTMGTAPMDSTASSSQRPENAGEGWIPREVFRTFLAVNRRLAAEANLEKAMDYLLDAAVTLTGARTGYLLLVRRDGLRLELRSGDMRAAGMAFSRSLVHRAIHERRAITSQEAVVDRDLMDMPSVRGLQAKSVLCVPFTSSSGTEGALYVEHPGRPGVFGEVEKAHLEVLADQAAIAVDRMIREEQLGAELERSRRSLEVVKRTRRRTRTTMLGKSPRMAKLREELQKLASSELSLLIVGETGTGKELVARTLHEQSAVAAGPFVSVNCAAIPAELMESELFGHKRGAFTGADEDRQGLMELASGGTLFLDEVGDMPLPLQAKLLRALQEGMVRPVGSGDQRPIHVRVVSATHRDLRAMIAQGTFRQDLFYRLAGAEVAVPPLRERGEDIVLLAEEFLSRLNVQYRRTLLLGPAGRRRLLEYGWPGNVRELEHVVARAAILAEGDKLDDFQLAELAQTAQSTPADGTNGQAAWPAISLHEAETRTVRAVLAATGGDKTKAAKRLGISRTALYEKLKRMGGES